MDDFFDHIPLTDEERAYVEAVQEREAWRREAWEVERAWLEKNRVRWEMLPIGAGDEFVKAMQELDALLRQHGWRK